MIPMDVTLLFPRVWPRCRNSFQPDLPKGCGDVSAGRMKKDRWVTKKGEG